MKACTKIGAGLSLNPAYYDEAYRASAPGLWFEFHPESYMVAGGPRLAWLDSIRSNHPLSMHGVSLSLGADRCPDASHLVKLKRIADRIEPVLISEHLAWSAWRGHYYPNLLPFPLTNYSLIRVAENINKVQDTLRRRIAIENPAHYLELGMHDWAELDFFIELIRRTGCGLLLDVNNAYISAHNLDFDPSTYLDAVPADAVMEIHLAGYDTEQCGAHSILIDSHGAAVSESVWQLYERLVRRIGSRPTLIERDDNIPKFDTLLFEQARAQSFLNDAIIEGATKHGLGQR